MVLEALPALTSDESTVVGKGKYFIVTNVSHMEIEHKTFKRCKLFFMCSLLQGPSKVCTSDDWVSVPQP